MSKPGMAVSSYHRTNTCAGVQVETHDALLIPCWVAIDVIVDIADQLWFLQSWHDACCGDSSSACRLAAIVDIIWMIIGVHPDQQAGGSCAAEMYKLLLETPHHPECSGQPLDWDLLFSGLSAPAPAAAQPRSGQAEAGKAGHVWPGTIIRGPSQDFTIECA